MLAARAAEARAVASEATAVAAEVASAGLRESLVCFQVRVSCPQVWIMFMFVEQAQLFGANEEAAAAMADALEVLSSAVMPLLTHGRSARRRRRRRHPLRVLPKLGHLLWRRKRNRMRLVLGRRLVALRAGARWQRRYLLRLR